ncbi:MAG: CopG family transcriptional regulator [Desulfurococcaceae archaeon]
MFSVKIKKELKEKMDKYKGKINWAEEVRRFIEETLRKLEAESNFELVLKQLEVAEWSVPVGFSASTVREDRDSS